VIETTSFRVGAVRDIDEALEEGPVRLHQSGTRWCRHPLTGDSTFAYARLEPPVDPALGIVTYSARGRVAVRSRLQELARWVTRTGLAAAEASAR
jgi:hypothetical protein